MTQSLNDQVINVDGRYVRLIPENKFSHEEASKCPKLVVKAKDGFYVIDPFGRIAYDVTELWRATRG